MIDYTSENHLLLSDSRLEAWLLRYLQNRGLFIYIIYCSYSVGYGEVAATEPDLRGGTADRKRENSAP